MRITGTFLDEITHDIPSWNWDESDWDREFALMRHIGIDKVIMIRCGSRGWVAYPSAVLKRRENAILPPNDLVAMFMKLCLKHDIRFFFGTYFSGRDWLSAAYDAEAESDLICEVCGEAWERYFKGNPAFGGWYLSQEINTAASFNVVKCYRKAGKFCKELSGNLPIIISPGINGIKNRPESLSPALKKRLAITLEEHRRDFDGIFGEIKDVVDIVAFQDGHVNFDELESYLRVNKELADRHGLACWTNAETFDRDIPGSFPPIKWEKLWYKLEAAQRVGINNAITFDFAHFLSPSSCYPQAANLLRNYCRWAGIDAPVTSR